MAEHSPIENWEYDGKFQIGITLPDGSLTGFRAPKAEAAYIFKACTAYPELVKALKRSSELLTAARLVILEHCPDADFTFVDGIPTDGIGFSIDCENAEDNARDLLSKLESA